MAVIYLQAEPVTRIARSIPTLSSMCQSAILEGLSPSSACSAVSLVDLLQPVLDQVAPALITYLARHLEQIVEADPQGFRALPASLVAELLGNPCLVRCSLNGNASRGCQNGVSSQQV